VRFVFDAKELQMANIQQYLEDFHDVIRADYDMNGTLREKRDIVVDLIKRRLKEGGHLTCDQLLQGSYRMGTGVKPIGDLEYDIDIGLRFWIKDTDYAADEVRKWVLEAVDGHTDSVEEKGPCIRVGYSKGFHLDLVMYAAWTDEAGLEQFRLAHRDNGWQRADPSGLLEHVKNGRKRFEGSEDNKTNTDQLRRIVRYLKRWGDFAIPFESDAKPAGIAYVLYAVQHLENKRFWDGGPDDRTALCNLSLLAANTYGRVSVFKPVPEYEDIFARLSEDDMKALKERSAALADRLAKVAQETDPAKACKLLQEVFGPDFPVPSPEETARKTSTPAIVTSASSA
jgi:hypothetical protein